jgi:16S rRNA (cytosine1402-N4)-methyltransferase
MPQTQVHTPVLLQEVLELLAPKMGERYLDLTAGYGGHAKAILDITNSSATLVDRDNFAIEELRNEFKEQKGITILHKSFLEAVSELRAESKTFDIILVDLGVSSPHLDKASRGFSLGQEGPLDMRMDSRQELSAFDVVNSYSEEELTEIISTYGEEPKAKFIAKLIVQSRPLTTTTQLAEIAKRAWPYNSRTHPATRLFQAIRIAVNGELEQLEKALPYAADLLSDKGRLGIISFHSLEDRIVKNFTKEHSGERYDVDFISITKKPVTASPDELAINPRSRSAKLRVVAKIKTKEGQG